MARYVRSMDNGPKKSPMQQSLNKALDRVGGEKLEGSGFENETPDAEFSESESAGSPTQQ
jgi:hypothetical protein